QPPARDRSRHRAAAGPATEAVKVFRLDYQTATPAASLAACPCALHSGHLHRQRIAMRFVCLRGNQRFDVVGIAFATSSLADPRGPNEHSAKARAPSNFGSRIIAIHPGKASGAGKSRLFIYVGLWELLRGNRTEYGEKTAGSFPNRPPASHYT